jgi:hypothetical protein
MRPKRWPVSDRRASLHGAEGALAGGCGRERNAVIRLEKGEAMSRFLVQDKTINQIIGWLNHSDSRHDREVILAVAGIPEDDEDWTTKLGISMFQLNCDALTARYGDGEPLSVYRFRWENVSRMQVYKSLRCWLHQCAEGDLTERPLYQAFERLSTEMAHGFLAITPEYKNAEWG